MFIRKSLQMNIEFFSTAKSCEQGCSTCPMARKDEAVTDEGVDPKVQQSFSLLERMLRRSKTHYDLHLGSSPRLFPKLKYPELMRKVRLETSKEVYSPEGQRQFTENVREVFESHKLDPKILGFSLVPRSPLVSNLEVEVIQNIFDSLAEWFYAKKYRTIDVTIRSNLIKQSLYRMVLPQLSETDNLYLKKLARDFGAPYKEVSEPSTDEDWAGGDIYCSEYKSKFGTQRFTVSNRVITSRRTEDKEALNVEQIKFVYPRHPSYLGFAVAPRGIMLMHTSLTINNPICWVSHDDFRNILKKKVIGPHFSYVRLVQKTILQNLTMYRHTLKRKGDIVVTNDDYLQIFQHLRPNFKK